MIQKRSNSKAYKGIMTFMSELKNYMVSKHPEYVAIFNNEIYHRNLMEV